MWCKILACFVVGVLFSKGLVCLCTPADAVQTFYLRTISKDSATSPSPSQQALINRLLAENQALEVQVERLQAQAAASNSRSSSQGDLHAAVAKPGPVASEGSQLVQLVIRLVADEDAAGMGNEADAIPDASATACVAVEDSCVPNDEVHFTKHGQPNSCHAEKLQAAVDMASSLTAASTAVDAQAGVVAFAKATATATADAALMLDQEAPIDFGSEVPQAVAAAFLSSTTEDDQGVQAAPVRVLADKGVGGCAEDSQGPSPVCLERLAAPMSKELAANPQVNTGGNSTATSLTAAGPAPTAAEGTEQKSTKQADAVASARAVLFTRPLSHMYNDKAVKARPSSSALTEDAGQGSSSAAAHCRSPVHPDSPAAALQASFDSSPNKTKTGAVSTVSAPICKTPVAPRPTSGSRFAAPAVPGAAASSPGVLSCLLFHVVGTLLQSPTVSVGTPAKHHLTAVATAAPAAVMSPPLPLSTQRKQSMAAVQESPQQVPNMAILPQAAAPPQAKGAPVAANQPTGKQYAFMLHHAFTASTLQTHCCCL